MEYTVTEYSNADQMNRALVTLAALVDGDRELDAEAAALLLGNLPLATFYKLAASPDFPRPVKIGKGRKWRRLALLEWADDLRRKQNRTAPGFPTNR